MSKAVASERVSSLASLELSYDVNKPQTFMSKETEPITEKVSVHGKCPSTESVHPRKVSVHGKLRIILLSARFLQQVKSECHFSNGMEHVRYLQRHIYNQEEHLRFDSDVGKYQAVTELGRIQAEYWNSQKGFLEQKRAKVDTFCRFNYAIVGILTVQQRGVRKGGEVEEGGGNKRGREEADPEPKVTVYPTKTRPLDHHNLLVCSVSGFYPGHIEVRWFQNGQEEKTGVVSTGLIRNGDWTYQTLVMLETVPQSGEVYTCQVEHSSLTNPVRVEWRAQPTSAQNKMLSGVGGFVLGLLFLGLGLFIYIRTRKDSLDFSRQFRQHNKSLCPSSTREMSQYLYSFGSPDAHGIDVTMFIGTDFD
ncbi:hypothetical protein STEG23_006334 [Scotinomys teguina]